MQSKALANAHEAPVWREVAYLSPHATADQRAITALCLKDLTTDRAAGRAAISPAAAA